MFISIATCALMSLFIQHRPAIVAMLAAMACLATQDSLAKLLMVSLAPVVIIWSRYTLQTLLATTSLWRRRSVVTLATRSPGLQLLRGTLVVLGSAFGYAALQRMPVAEFTAVYCLVPLTVTLAGRCFLHEPVRPAVWWCVALGIAGVLLVVRPGTAVDPAGTALALCGVSCYTGFQLLTTVLARHDSPLCIHFYTSLQGMLVFSMLVPFFWPHDWTASQLFLLGLVALAGTGGQYFMVLAFAKAPVSVVSPYLQTAIVFSAFWGWVLFDHVPDALALAGMGLIASSGVAVARLKPLTST